MFEPTKGSIPGPKGRIAFSRDALGYPSIRVRDDLEGAYARGYFHALDRLVQVRLTGVAARGNTMEMLGDKPLARAIDRMVRTFGFSSDIDERIAALSAPTRRWLEMYCDGFAAGEARRGRPWPLRLLGIKPERYSLRDIFLTYRLVAFFGLTSLQATAELLVAELIASSSPPRVLDLLLGESGRGLDRGSLAGLKLDPSLSLLSGQQRRGSNAFAVSGARSQSGGAMLMGEFHLEVGKFPPTLYALHLDYDDGSFYQGLSIPGVAWISAGRTEKVAWSYTYGHADNVDIRVTKERPTLRKRTEKVKIRGASAETWMFSESEHGSVVSDSAGGGPVAHLRWSGLRENHRDIEVAFRIRELRNVAEAVELHREMRAVSLQGVFADSAGDIASVQTGQVDRREDGWTGAYPARVSEAPTPVGEAARPVSIRPEEGFIASANQASSWTTLPEPRYRYDRLREMLAAMRQATLADLVATSYDEADPCWDRLAPVWAPLLPEPTKLTRGLFHALHDEIVVALLSRDLGPEAARRFADLLGGTLLFESHLDDALALERPALLTEDELRQAIEEAWRPAKARADKTHPVRARFVNALTLGKEPALLGLSSAPVTFPGGPTSVFQSRRVHFLEEELMFGPAFHFVTDMSERGAFYHVPGGASEQRWGPGYGKGVEMWREGRFITLGTPTSRPPNLKEKPRQS